MGSPTPYILHVALTLWCSNKVDLQLLREMGVHPAPGVALRKEKRKLSLRTVGLGVVGCVRMMKLREQWAGSRKLQESLMLKLEAVKGRRKSVAARR